MHARAALPCFLAHPGLRLLLFGGKGGVGKTTCACASALRLAGQYPERTFLLVSTDPAHSLVDCLAGSPDLPNLETLELDSQEVLGAFKGAHQEHLREIALRGTFLDEDDIAQFLDLSLPGLDELMAFLEIGGWVDDRAYDCIIVDTAPTGHTRRLLAMPDTIRKWLDMLDTLLAKHRYMKEIFAGAHRRDELDTFLEGLSCRVRKMESLLQDAARCRFIPVMLAEALSVSETVALVNDLESRRIPVTDIVINKLYPENECPTCSEGRRRQREELHRVLDHMNGYLLWGVPLYPDEVRGPQALDAYWNDVAELSPSALSSPAGLEDPSPRVEMPGQPFEPDLEFLLFAGKGGVGKTTLACATALRMVGEFSGREILLFSTDPAHSLSDCLGLRIGASPTRICPGLSAMEIDAEAEFKVLKRQYEEELATFLQGLLPNVDLAFDRDVMEKILDLSPPGLDEVMALTRVMEFLGEDQYDLFIVDSAPTGHLIRLLELPDLLDRWLKALFGLFLKYKRVFRLPRVSARLVGLSKNLKGLRALLTDPERAVLCAVAILTEMSFEETKDLVQACERMGVTVPALLLNLATPASECPLCLGLHRGELQVKQKFQELFPDKRQTVVYRRGEPRGLRQIGRLGQALYETASAGTLRQCAG